MSEELPRPVEALKAHAPQLKLALRGCESEVVYFLEREGFISSDVTYDEILSHQSKLNEGQKADRLVECIRNRVSQNPDSLYDLMKHLESYGERYKPILKILKEFLENPVQQQTLAQQPTLPPPAASIQTLHFPDSHEDQGTIATRGSRMETDDDPEGESVDQAHSLGIWSKTCKYWWIIPLAVLLSLYFRAGVEEKALYNEVVQAKFLPPPERGTKEFIFLQEHFCPRVELILQTVSENEFDAATTYIKSPNDNMFSDPVTFPKGSMVLGMFAGKRTALVQTKVGEFVGDFVEEAIKSFPNALYVIGVGGCYSFDRTKYKLGDVLVSERISNLANYKWDKEGRVENRGDTVSVIDDLYRIFCQDLKHKPPFEVSAKGRHSKVHSGNIISHPHLIDNKEIRDKFHEEIRTAIGGEMEGGELLKFVRKEKIKRNIKGVIVIKGVFNYADGQKANDWQYTATLAALSYVKSKLEFELSFLDEDNQTGSDAPTGGE